MSRNPSFLSASLQRLTPATRPRGARTPMVLFVGFLLMLAPLVSGCHLIFPYPVVKADSYQCAAKITVAKPAALDCQNYIKVTSTHSQPVQVSLFSNSTPGTLPKLYLDPIAYVPTADGTPEVLKGTCLVRLPYDERTSNAHPYLSLSFSVPVENVYVAFDRRGKPVWLNAFNAVSGATLQSTEKTSADPSSPNVQYQVYEPKDPMTFANAASFDGNNLNTIWQANKVGSQYLVFVKKTQPSTVKPESFPVTIEACGAPVSGGDIQKAYDAARQHEKDIIQDWVADHADYQQAYKDGQVSLSFQASDCAKVESISTPKYPKSCGKTDDVNSTQQAVLVNAWPKLSTASIDSAVSSVTVQVRNTTQTVPAGGPISFHIDENSNAIIDEATIFSNSLVVEDVHIDNVSIGQRGATIASCIDNPVPKPFGLCTNYIIPATNAAFAGIGADVDGRHVFTPLINNQAIAVTVDHNNKVFKMSGAGIDGQLDTDDGPLPVKVSVDVTGKFENFAPVASAKESPKRFECKDGNKAYVKLDASASYDRDQTSNTLLYKWVEDAGTPAERVLGTQKVLTNLPMNFGGHRITLSVEDNRGATTSVSFNVEVYDSRIDSYKPPADVYAVMKGAHTPVTIGTATANDGCSGKVRILNNGPNNTFPSGFTPVEWIFDDYHGNVVRHWQNVFVLPAKMSPAPIATGLAWIAGAQGQPQSLIYIYGTKAQGTAISADEYILIETPSGDIYSIDGQNKIGKPNEIVPHGSAKTFGGNDTAAFVIVDQWNTKFPKKGAYAIKHILVIPKGDPKNNRRVIAYHQFDWNQ